jgi:hypothetical protein
MEGLVIIFGTGIVIAVSIAWLEHRTRTKALDVLRTYAERGEEPPASIVEAIAAVGSGPRPGPRRGAGCVRRDLPRGHAGEEPGGCSPRRAAVDLVKSADDLAQETFIVAWTRPESYRGGASVRSWLCAIAWHKATGAQRAWFRRRARGHVGRRRG